MPGRHAPLLNARYYFFWIWLTACITGLSDGACAQEQQEAEERLQQLEQTLEARKQEQEALEAAAENAKSEAERLSRRLVIIGRDMQIAEGNALRLEDRISILETEEKSKEDALASRQDELLELLSALERLSKRPAALALLQPQEALKTAQSASLMGSIVPSINEKAAELRLDLANLAIIQTKLSNERFQLKNTLERLTEHQLKVGSLVQRRQTEARKAAQDAAETRREIAKFAQEAASLKELIEKLAQRSANLAKKFVPRPTDRPDKPVRPDDFRPDSRPIREMRGNLPYPVMGRVTGKFGAREAVGEARGIRIESRPGAQVVAPYDGKIVFAGPFKNYGQLLIIEHGEGYHSLMAGFGQLYGSVGQWVLTGEPIGVMTSKRSANQLYLELRSGGQAINPEPWLSRRLASRN